MQYPYTVESQLWQDIFYGRPRGATYPTIKDLSFSEAMQQAESMIDSGDYSRVLVRSHAGTVVRDSDHRHTQQGS
ncbi:MAG: hypothetical protein OXG06_06390 [Gammaproteobacteria bacterium]|nr:hypothetical protein [Gammaproteobacteria bacterium]